MTLLIFYEPSEIKPVFEDGKTTVDCVFSNTVRLDCEYFPDKPGVIKVSNILIAKQNPGRELSLTLTNQEILVEDPTTTKSWTMVTYEDEETKFAIDQITADMTFTFTCKLPCLTCLDTDPDHCLSCN